MYGRIASDKPLDGVVFKHKKHWFFACIVISAVDFKRGGWFYLSGNGVRVWCCEWGCSGSPNSAVNRVLSGIKIQNPVAFCCLSYNDVFNDVQGLLMCVLSLLKFLSMSSSFPCIQHISRSTHNLTPLGFYIERLFYLNVHSVAGTNCLRQRANRCTTSASVNFFPK